MSDISELFARDPVGLSDQNIDAIVAKTRELIAAVELGVKAAPKPKPKSPKTLDLLKDLGLT